MLGIDFARKPYREDVDRLRAALSPNNLVEKVAKRAAELRALGEDSINAFFEVGPPSFEALNDYQDLLKRDLLQWLLSGEVRAFGFETPRRADSEPIEVPRDIWTALNELGTVSLENDKVASGSLKIESVRVLRSETIEAHQSRNSTPAAPATRPGRPSRRDQIAAAYQALKDEDALDFRLSFSANHPQIKQRVLEMFPDEPQGEKGLGVDVMRKEIGADYAENHRTAKSG